MGIKDAVNAYRDSLNDGLQYRMEARIGARSFPIVGGLWSGLKGIGNSLFRPFKVGGALVMGYGEPTSTEIKMPEMPKEFKGTDLEKALKESAELRKKALDARVESFEKLLNLDITGAWKKASVASYAEAKDRQVVMSEEGEAMAAASQGSSNGLGVFVAREGGRALGSVIAKSFNR